MKEGLQIPQETKIPKVVWDESGSYHVQLIASNDFGTDTIRRSVDIFVFPSKNFYGENLVEGFEHSVIGKDLYQRNGTNDGTKWKITSKAALTGTKSITRNSTHLGLLPPDIDRLILPPMDISKLEAPTLKFSIALAKKKGTD